MGIVEEAKDVHGELGREVVEEVASEHVRDGAGDVDEFLGGAYCEQRCQKAMSLLGRHCSEEGQRVEA